MNFFTALFTPSPPHNYPAELKAINARMEAKPGNMADHDRRSEILFQLGNTQAALDDFEMATKLEPDHDLKALRSRELQEMKKRFS